MRFVQQAIGPIHSHYILAMLELPYQCSLQTIMKLYFTMLFVLLLVRCSLVSIIISFFYWTDGLYLMVSLRGRRLPLSQPTIPSLPCSLLRKRDSFPADGNLSHTTLFLPHAPIHVATGLFCQHRLEYGLGFFF